MAITAPASLSKIITEFGGPNNLSAYVRGGSYVPNSAANAAISTTASGLAISQFVGASADGVVNLNAHTINDDGFSGGFTGLAKFLLYNNGTAGKDGNNQTAALYSGEWLQGGTPGDYECMATLVTDTGGIGTKTGTLGTWMALSTTRSWSYSKNPTASTSWVINVAIRKIGTTTNLDSANITLTASGPGAGGTCVVMGSWMDSFFRVEDARVGQSWMTHTPEDGFVMEPVHAAHAPVWADSVRIVTESGATLRCSKTTPFNLRTAKVDKEDGHWRYATQMEGEYVMVDRNSMVEWERVVRVENIGLHLVVPVSFGGRSFAAGDTPEARIYSHNMAKTIP